MTDPHNLFKLTSYLNSQEDFIHHIVPELTRLDQKVDLNNIRQFDELLTYFETSFKMNAEASQGNASPYANLVLPSHNVIRVLLTLAALVPGTNRISKAMDIDGVPATTEYIKGLSDDYFHALAKPPLKNRTIWILEQYCQILYVETSQNDPVGQLLYSRILVGLTDFIVRSRLVKSKGNTIKKKAQASPSKQHKITSFFQSSPIKEPVPEWDEISDSEPEITLINSQANIENELRKYQDSPPKPNFILDGDRQVAGLKNSFGLFDSMKRKPEDPDEEAPAKKIKPPADGVLHKWENIRVFGQELIGKRLNPELNHRFSLWLLMNWAFYCADRSSQYQKTHINSHFTSYHLIYTTYNELLQVLYDLIALNFTRTLKSYPPLQKKVKHSSDLLLTFFSISNHTRADLLNYLESCDFLIHSLLTQLDSKQEYWYDRLVEYVLNGLGQHSLSAPVPCYEHERYLIRSDKVPREKFVLPANYTSKDNDNLESMMSRYRFISLVYYRSLFFTNGSVVGYNHVSSNPHLCSQALIRELVLKFSALDFMYLREFYWCLGAEEKHFPKFYEQAMLVDIAATLFLDITKSVEFDLLSLDRSPLVNPKVRNEIWQKQNLESVLSVISDKETYLMIARDEPKSDQAWLKATFILEFLLDITLDDYSLTETSSEFIKEAKKICSEADIIRNTATNADTTGSPNTFSYADIFSRYFGSYVTK